VVGHGLQTAARRGNPPCCPLKGQMWRRLVRPGVAWHGDVGCGKPRCGGARHGLQTAARRGFPPCCPLWDRHGTEWRNTACLGRAGCGPLTVARRALGPSLPPSQRVDTARFGWVGHGLLRHVWACSGVDWQGLMISARRALALPTGLIHSCLTPSHPHPDGRQNCRTFAEQLQNVMFSKFFPVIPVDLGEKWPFC
jgi:hypothetical protein